MLYIPDSRYPKYAAQSTEVKKLLGLEGKPLPEAGMAPLHLPALRSDGQARAVKVWVAPLARKIHIRTSVHRVLCECPDCGWTGSVGRLAQHVCGA